MGCGDEKLSKYLTQTFTAHCNAMICQQVTLSGDAEWPKVADAVIEADFVAVVDQVIVLLRQRGRVTYRTLQRQFQLDNTAMDDLKDELIYGQRLAVDE